MEPKIKQFAITCDLEGMVIQVLNDDYHVLPNPIVGNMFFSAVVPSDLDKILNFFLLLKSQGTAVDWELNINSPSGPETFTFFGGIFNDNIWIAAATATNVANLLFNELTAINNEQANLIRDVVKENMEFQTETSEPAVSFYEELSRLNNELVNMQREMSKANVRLAELNKLKNQFLGIAAHDLRSPIGVIMGYSELLIDSMEDYDAAQTRDLLERIHNTSKFMLGLVNDLLDLANIESGQLDLNLSAQELGEVVNDVILMTEIFIRTKSMEIVFEKPDQPVPVIIDRPKIEQVLTNLLSNAIKYSFPGSKILMRLRTDEFSARINVVDQGQGIKDEELDRLFKPFHKTSTRSTAGEKSTGLGLSIVKKIVESHGGTVGVLSIFGKGSEFSFTLPLKS